MNLIKGFVAKESHAEIGNLLLLVVQNLIKLFLEYDYAHAYNEAVRLLRC